MSTNASRRNQAKLKKYVHAQRNTNDNRESSRSAPSSEAVRSGGCVGNQPKELDYLVLWAIEESVVLNERTLTYNIRLLAMDRVFRAKRTSKK
jgi:hypothetical protein